MCRFRYSLFSLVLCFFCAEPLYADTSMSILLEKQNLDYLASCKGKLLQMADTVVGKREHRLFAAEPKTAKEPSDAVAKGVGVFYVSGVVSYRDRDVHVGFTAMPQGKKTCQVLVTKSFTVKEPCIAVREEIFKKWDYLGQLNPQTMVLRNKKMPAEQALLSNQFMGKACLATTNWIDNTSEK